MSRGLRAVRISLTFQTARAWIMCAALIFLATPAAAVQPDEILSDPTLEARARALSTGLRCLVCQNQSIDESDAPLARDLRLLIREQLQQNRTDAQVLDFVVARYGDYVLLKPRLQGGTLVLWLAPFALLAGAGVYLYARRQRPVPAPDSLTQGEEQRLRALLKHTDSAKKSQ
jgi:cytochrome c-type biogenesis protein CcmH